jgi:lipid-binding SYLF domain-containing protein
MASIPAAAGDVLAVWTGNGAVQDFIRVGEALLGKPVAVVAAAPLGNGPGPAGLSRAP